MKTLKIKSIKRVGVGNVRNLTVHKNHTFLTKNGITTHNCDGASDQFFKALRGTIEKYANFARFIVTCNYLEKIPDPIQSRFNVINLDVIDEAENEEMKIKYYNRVVKILQDSGMSAEEKAIMKIGDTYFPDLRAMTTALETIHLKGVTHITESHIKEYDTKFEELYELLINSNDAEKNYIFISANYMKRADDVLASLGNDFIEYLRIKDEKYKVKIPEILITVAEHQYKTKFVIDKLVNLLSVCFTIQTILKK